MSVSVKLLKKLHRVRATGDVKPFHSKVLHVAWPEPQRNRRCIWAWSNPIISINVSNIAQKRVFLPSAHWVCAFCFNFRFKVCARSRMFMPALFGFIYINQSLTNYDLLRRFHECWNLHCLKFWHAHQHTA